MSTILFRTFGNLRLIMKSTENTQILRKAKYHCTADLLFD